MFVHGQLMSFPWNPEGLLRLIWTTLANDEFDIFELYLIAGCAIRCLPNVERLRFLAMFSVEP
jgi:hypothetical protein